MKNDRAARAEHVIIEALNYREECGTVRPGLAFKFINFRNETLADVEFGGTYDQLLGFVAAVQRIADRSTTLAIEANEKAQADAN
jgi:hypothetical protein